MPSTTKKRKAPTNDQKPLFSREDLDLIMEEINDLMQRVELLEIDYENMKQVLDDVVLKQAAWKGDVI